MLFIDALRVDKLSLFNNEIKNEVYLDKYIRELGGELFNNCFTSSPDTYRSLASLFTGKNSDVSNCNSYSKPLFPFCESKTIWDIALQNNFYIDIFHPIFENYIFPKKIQNNISKEINIRHFKNNLKLKNNHLVWIGLDDFRHYSYYDKYNHKNIFKNLNKLGDVLKILNKEFIDEFDHVFIFSDHGILFDNEFLKLSAKKFEILDEKRTQVFLFYKQKNDDYLKINNNLLYLSDMYEVIISLLAEKKVRKIKKREYLLVEDMDFSSMNLTSKPVVYSLITNKYIYIRSFIQKIGTIYNKPEDDKAYYIDRINNTRFYIQPDKNKDNIMFTNQNFLDIYKIYYFWMKKNTENIKLKKEIGIVGDGDLNSFGEIITHKNEFSLFNIIKLIKLLMPPIFYQNIKKLIKFILLKKTKG